MSHNFSTIQKLCYLCITNLINIIIKKANNEQDKKGQIKISY